MFKKNFPTLSLTIVFLLLILSCKKTNTNELLDEPTDTISIDSTLVTPFFKKFPEFEKYKSEMEELYQKKQYKFIWFDSKKTSPIADQLFHKILNLHQEGVSNQIPYKKELIQIFNDSTANHRTPKSELLLSSFYFFYANKVLKGIEIEKSRELGWLLPRKKHFFVSYLDSILAQPDLLLQDKKSLVAQYFQLKKSLVRFRSLAQKKEWKPISFVWKMYKIRRDDSLKNLLPIRTRLYQLGYIESDSKSPVYDDILIKGILKYKYRNGFDDSIRITSSLISHLNVPPKNRIASIIANMERCRWLSNKYKDLEEYIFVNIPSYKLEYFKKQKTVLESKVVVGDTAHRTKVFRGDMKFVVFNPYWNVTRNILKTEILPAIEKNPNYLKENDMEWHRGIVRQRPGPKNALGQVKFLFPNRNSIYLHDSPLKSLYGAEKRAFSHGCIRVEKQKELLHLILENDTNWTPDKIECKLEEGTEDWYRLKKKIPIFICYFTAWPDEDGTIRFFDDVYQKDEKLAALVLEN